MTTETAPVTPALEEAAERAERRRGFRLALPGFVYLVFFFAIPLVIVFVYSFATRSATGKTLLEDWNLESYRQLAKPLVLEIAWRSLWLAALSTVICLVLASTGTR